MRIGILGSGLMGAKLGTIFARAGHEVAFSYSRSERKLRRLAREAGARARAGTPREAARDADAVLLAVNWPRLDDVLKQAGSLAGTVVVSCVMPIGVDVSGTSGAEILARRLRGAHFVSAFGTVPSEVLFDVFEARRRAKRPSMIYCGNDRRAKKVAVELIRDAGFEPIDAGPLRIARHAEPFTHLIAQLAYEGSRGPELSYRLEWHGR